MRREAFIEKSRARNNRAFGSLPCQTAPLLKIQNFFGQRFFNKQDWESAKKQRALRRVSRIPSWPQGRGQDVYASLIISQYAE
jgi:hypothetical protein